MASGCCYPKKGRGSNIKRGMIPGGGPEKKGGDDGPKSPESEKLMQVNGVVTTPNINGKIFLNKKGRKKDLQRWEAQKKKGNGVSGRSWWQWEGKWAKKGLQTPVLPTEEKGLKQEGDGGNNQQNPGKKGGGAQIG